ncbi:TetR/AcrR family transcriptional regulator [Kutzneria sp. NPDC052558]|uniref:TetR/AcrR family transcriptional regulator n=1 Tax=Kutzneria sp. NPDC052558 TaxID=3364121 RepID=UPI0037C573E9
MAGVTRRRAQTRERLVEAAYEVFAEFGIRDAPVELICERAGFTRGAFYSNFASKEQLFLAVHEVQAQERVDRLRTAVASAINNADIADPDVATRVLRHTGELFMAALASDRTWYQLNVEFSAQALRQDELRPLTAAADERFQEALAEILVDTLAKLGRRLTVDVDSAVLTIIALYEATLKRAILRGADDRHYVTEVLPRLFAALIVPAEEETR